MPVIDYQNKKVFYQTYGAGPAVVLQHGFGENGQVWNRQVDALKSSHLVIVPDLPGSGKSEKLDGDVTMTGFARVIKTILDKEIKDEKCHLFGHSMGGYITMAFVDQFPEVLNSFGLVHSSAFADTVEKKETRKKGIDFIKKNGGHAFLKTVVPGLFSEESKSTHPEYVDELLNLTKEISDEALIQYYHAMMQRPDRSDLLKQSALPVLFLIGKHDQTIPLDVSLKQCQLPPVSSVTILEHSGHLGMWEETQKANDTLVSFLQIF